MYGINAENYRLIRTVPLGFIGKYGEDVMEASPVSYVKDAKLRGGVLPLMTPAALFRLLILDISSTNHNELLEL
jgi:hypothetical protein